MLPCFKRLETWARDASAVRGGEGPLSVTELVVRHPAVADFVDSACAIALPRVDDFNAGEHDGVGFLQANIRAGVRHSAYDAFIAPVRHRRNLDVRTGVHVTRVVVDGQQATGVEIVERGRKRLVAASREVILSAGALNSPHLLMLSGIGDGGALQRHGIRTLARLPGVGKNLQDHFNARMQFETTPESSCNRDPGGRRKVVPRP